MAPPLIIDFESLKRDNWSSEEVANAKMITDFMQRMMNDHDFDYVLKTYDNPHYLQHNRTLPEGFKGLVTFVKKFCKNFPDYVYDVKHICADGDVVVFHSHVTTNAKHRGNDKKGFNIVDKWRIENGQIVEHWDSIQALDFMMRLYMLFTGGSIRNNNGLF